MLFYIYLLFNLIIFFSCKEQSVQSDNLDTIIYGNKITYLSQIIDGENIMRKVVLHGHEDPLDNFLYPIVFFFHGNGGDAENWINSNQDLINDHQFIGIYPQGYKNSWNLGQERSNADDVEFIEIIMEYLVEYNNIDINKVFAIGTSNGSALVNELGIKVNFLRGIAPIASQLNINQYPSKNKDPISVYQVCGSDDDVIPYDGGISKVGHNFRSAHESAYLWADAMDCNSFYEINKISNDSLFTYSNCNQNNEILFRRVEGGNHNLNGKGRMIIRDIWKFFDKLN